jgi:hypothetical protein
MKHSLDYCVYQECFLNHNIEHIRQKKQTQGVVALSLVLPTP